MRLFLRTPGCVALMCGGCRRLANDLSAYATDRYKVHVVSGCADGGALRFHLGEQIKVAWQVPRHHSRRDWIGLYRVGANPSTLVTRTSSLGMWIPVHDEEWDGDFPISENSHASSPTGSRSSSSSSEGPDDEASGTVTFQGDGLPWSVGRYEVRYHHDGMYNVLALDGPIEIYGPSKLCTHHLTFVSRSHILAPKSSGPPRKSGL